MHEKDNEIIAGDAHGVPRVEIARAPCEENMSGAIVLVDDPFAIRARPGV